MMKFLKISVCICTCRFRKYRILFLLNISYDESIFPNKIYNTRKKIYGEENTQ